MFDKDLQEKFQAAITQAFQEHADVLRSVIVVFDYHGALNTTEGLTKALWMGPHGPVTSPEGISGSIQGLLRVLLQCYDRMQSFNEHIHNEIEAKMKELKEVYSGEEAAKAESGPEQTEEQESGGHGQDSSSSAGA